MFGDADDDPQSQQSQQAPQKQKQQHYDSFGDPHLSYEMPRSFSGEAGAGEDSGTIEDRPGSGDNPIYFGEAQKDAAHTGEDGEDEQLPAGPWYVRCGRALRPPPCPWTFGMYLRLGFVLVIVGLLIVAVIFRNPIRAFLSPDGPLAKFVDEVGWWGPIVYAAIYAICTVLMVPGTVLTLTAGVIFSNLWIAVGTISVGSTVGACMAMPLGRTVLRKQVKSKVAQFPVFDAVDTAVGQKGFLMVGLLRLSPVIPFNVLNYGLGLTAVPFWQYALASWLGMLPGTFMYVYIPWAAKNAAVSKQTNDTATIIKDILLYGVGSVVTIAVVVFVTWVGRRELKKVMDAQEAGRLGDSDENTQNAGVTRTGGSVNDPAAPLLGGADV
jgi:uncharacterized membrane protein YdjX (TVP38/TMEM64 family)